MTLCGSAESNEPNPNQTPTPPLYLKPKGSLGEPQACATANSCDLKSLLVFFLCLSTYLVISQDDLTPTHLADELQELAVLHLRVCITAQQVSQGFGIPPSGRICL